MIRQLTTALETFGTLPAWVFALLVGFILGRFTKRRRQGVAEELQRRFPGKTVDLRIGEPKKAEEKKA